ncbi:MAG: PEP-utilizing enzyme, partial [Wujia sp.]
RSSQYEALDIEFAIDKNGRVIVYQVRPLSAIAGRPKAITDHEFTDTKAYAKCSYLDTNHILSDMAYWGIAENTGSNPRPLDCSLYREFITSGIWNEGISKLGYTSVAEDLMQKVGNKPYISINFALDGLTPSGIDDKLRYKLKIFYEEKLSANKNLHDKIESEVIYNSFDFSTDIRLKELLDNGFTEAEVGRLRNALYDTTHNIVNEYDKICEEDKLDMDKLIELRHGIRNNSPVTETNTMKLYSYIKDLFIAIKEYGTPQFIRHSRCAFIAGSFCSSLVKMGYYTQEEMDSYLNSINTLASEFERDVDSYSSGEMSREDFNKLYGHLRLGTYDIRTDCYKEMYVDVANTGFNCKRKKQEIIRPDETRLREALRKSGMKLNVEQFFDYIEAAFQNRELYKFEYFKTLSLMLDIVIRIGDMLGIAREDMSYLEIQDLMDYHSRDTYIHMIQERRNMYYANTYLVLPDVIMSVGDIDVIDMCETKPEFITDKSVTADVVILDNSEEKNVSGKIVVLTKADPGYDWIFAKNLAGFVTKYGSATCHMAIRCAELGVPAAIGCGENIFSRVSLMSRMELDCANGKIIER